MSYDVYYRKLLRADKMKDALIYSVHTSLDSMNLLCQLIVVNNMFLMEHRPVPVFGIVKAGELVLECYAVPHAPASSKIIHIAHSG